MKTLPVLALTAVLVLAGCGGEPESPVQPVPSPPQERERHYLLALEASSAEAHALGRVRLLGIGGTVCDFADDLPDIEIQRQIQQRIGVSSDAAFAIVFQAKSALCPEKRYS